MLLKLISEFELLSRWREDGAEIVSEALDRGF